jgi:hypothetical protein
MDSDNANSISYTVDLKRRMFPISSTILVILDLIWILFANDKITAIILIFIFGTLSLVEFLMNWYRANSHYGVNYVLDSDGFTAIKGAYSKKYQWNQFAGFISEYQAKHGDFLRYIPFASLLYTPEEKYKLCLLVGGTEKMLSGDQQPIYLMTTPATYDKVVAFVKQFLTLKK